MLGFETGGCGWAPSAELGFGAGMTHDGDSDGIQWRWNKGAMQMEDETIPICVVSVSLHRMFEHWRNCRLRYLHSVTCAKYSKY